MVPTSRIDDGILIESASSAKKIWILVSQMFPLALHGPFQNYPAESAGHQLNCMRVKG